MGKAADNERRKIRATFFNNCSVALVVGGTALPLFALYSKLSNLLPFLVSITTVSEIPIPQALYAFFEVILVLSGAAISFVLAANLHSRCLKIIATIED